MNKKNSNRIIVIFSFIIAVITFIVVFNLRNPLNRPLPIVWNKETESKVPSRFAYLMFPKSNYVNIVEAKSEKIIAPLQRAMMNREVELHESKYITAIHKNNKGRVLLSELSFLPVPELAEQQISTWKKVFISFGEWRSADVKFKKISDTETEVTILTILNDGGRNQYIYQTDGINSRAIEWRGLSDAGGAMRSLIALIVSGFLGLMTFLLSCVLLKFIIKNCLTTCSI